MRGHPNPISPKPISKAPEETPVNIAKVINGLNGQLHDAFFDYDRADVRPDAVAALQHDANLLLPMLSDFPQLRVIIEGHCDERGSAEYNLALGDRRASRAAEFLRGFGLPVPSSEMISYGKEAAVHGIGGKLLAQESPGTSRCTPITPCSVITSTSHHDESVPPRRVSASVGISDSSGIRLPMVPS